MAAVHVVCGPAGSGKTGRLLERLREMVRADPAAALWLVPTRRAADALRARLAESRAPHLGLRLLTFDEFADDVLRCNDAEARPLSDTQRRLLIDDVCADLAGRGLLPLFRGVLETRGFAEAASNFLAELSQNEISPETMAAAAGAGELTRERQCAHLYAVYRERLNRHRLVDAAGRLVRAAELLAAGRRRPFEGVRFVFVDGFTDFSWAQHDMLNALAAHGEALWITLPDEEGSDRAEMFTRPRATLAALAHLAPAVECADRPLVTYPCPSSETNGVARDSQGVAGLAHLERQLFRPLRAVRRSDSADGLLLIEAPGAVGEARLVAREIRRLLDGGARPEDVLVLARDIAPYADLVREVFGEYDIPLDVEGASPLLRNPAVATLLRCLRLPEEGWPFAAVTALLRSGYFRPDWPEMAGDAEMPYHAEALLRLLGEPRGREVYLRAVERWAEQAQPALEDEQAEERRRARTHELAKKCRDFLRHFFHAWDEAPHRAPLADHVGWLRRLAADLGLQHAATASADDDAALGRLWGELEAWLHTHRLIHGTRPVERAQFHHTLTALAATAGLARTPRGAGRVRFLSAPAARGLTAPYVFLLGLGERSFPRLSGPDQLLDEGERLGLRQAGVDLPAAADLLPDEMLLFYGVVTAARRRLVLSYAAVDDRGQALLPSSFLTRLLDCFTPGAVPTRSRRMLIQGYDSDTPLSLAERRVRAACAAASEGTLDRRRWKIAGDVADNLADAAEVSRLRFRHPDHTVYDGLLRDPAVIAEAARKFAPERILSPTALEGYIACPFRFFLGNVLRLEPLEEPSEEIESTDRGLAFHRALSRLHTELRAAGIHTPEQIVDDHFCGQLGRAVEECAGRASPAGEALWRLEGRRMLRLALRYRPHWQKFVEPWAKVGVRPRPEHFEVGFGLPEADGTERPPLVIGGGAFEVRISGRIDRVDVAELPDGAVGFWVIDYKTGRGVHYTGEDLKEFRRLQLTLYALAVEQVLFAGRAARPLGLAYWLVAEGGPKVALPHYRRPAAWLDDAAAWDKVRSTLRAWVQELVSRIRGGEFPLKPRSEHCTQTCDFGRICRISQSRSVVEEKSWSLPLPVTD